MSDTLEALMPEDGPSPTIVITYQSPRGNCISLTKQQVRALERLRRWPRNASGQEYCTVSYGAHRGRPTWSPDEFSRLVDQMAR